MSSMVSHELKQPLSAIENYAQSLKERLAGNGKAPDEKTLAFALERIDLNALKAIEIIEHVRGYSKGLPQKNEEVNLSALLEKAVRDFGEQHPEIVLSSDIPGNISATGDGFEVLVAVTNILKNAAKALKKLREKENLGQTAKR